MAILSCSVLVLQMLLLCIPAMHAAGNACVITCGEHSSQIHDDLISLDCGNSTIIIDYSMTSTLSLYLPSLDLTCTSADNSSVYTSRNIVCELDSTKSGHRTKTLNLTAEGILPGDDCVISGCYETKDMSTHTLHNVRCTVPRDCVWGEWSECAGECGEGRQTRSRVVVTTSKGTGRGCSGPSSQNMTCNSCTTVAEPIKTSMNSSTSDCNTTTTCHQYAVCTGLPTPQCSCLSGYTGDGYECVHVVTEDWMPLVVAVVTALIIFVAIAVILLSAIFIYRFNRRHRYLDHRRLRKLMGTFDPNFTPNLSTNLKKYAAVSEISVFDTLFPPTHHPQTDYITLDQLGIYIHTNRRRPSDSDSCMELDAAGLPDSKEESSLQTVNCSQSPRNSIVNGSTFSLDVTMVQALFQMPGTFHNSYAMSDDSEGRDTPDSEPQDFVEDMLRIDIENISDEEDGQYIVTEGGERTVECLLQETVERNVSPEVSEPQDFVEDMLRIDIDNISDEEDNQYIVTESGLLKKNVERNVSPEISLEIVSDDDCSQPCDVDECYINVGGVCFTYPSSEHIEHSQWTNHSTDFNKAHSSQPSLALEQNCHLLPSPFSTSTPSIFVNNNNY